MFKDPFAPKKRKRSLTAADKKRIAAKQNWKCKKCKRLLPARYHIDHIKEFSGGGSDRESNLQALCSNCHSEKTEQDRHKKKQAKIRSKEKEESGGLFGGSSLLGPAPKRKKSENPFGGSIFGEQPKKRGKKKKSNNPFDFGF